MKKVIKLKQLVQASLLSVLLSTGYAQADNVDNWRDNGSQLVWMNGTDEHCWRDGFWTNQTAASVKCGKPAPVVPVAPPVIAPQPPIVGPVVAPPVAPRIITEKFSYSADALFDFDKATLKPQGQTALSELAQKLKDPAMKLEVVVAVGHTDSFGKDAYNDRLSLARANSVKLFLVGQGLPASMVFAEGKGKRQLKVDPATCPKKRADRIACEAPSRRVEVEVTGVKTITRVVQ